VLATLAMVASVLVAAPTVAADDPMPDYTATFDACGMAPSSGFEDVPSGHANAGDIDCIAYYGITKGTSATTYSPTMSVTREHMALFLTRLAGLVEIDVVSNPDDAGFTDVGELSAESQTAINQLADLGVTTGTSATTYSPADSVTRGQMALFISRLMDKMTPMMDGKTPYGYTPSKVVAVEDDPDTLDKDETKKIGSPFNDLGNVTKTTYDAITNLYELDVATGVNPTSYGPSALITRASMAGFMAGVLNHSNARPAGISIQAAKTWDFDTFSTPIAVSYRDDGFMPMADKSIKIFNLDDITEMKLQEDGTCKMASDCEWSDAEDLTDASGNIYLDGDVMDGKKNTYYAWMGAKNGDKFDADTSNPAMVTLSSTTDATQLVASSDISKNSRGDNTVDLDADNSVTVTVQLADTEGKKVAKSGVKINVAVNMDTGSDDSVESINPNAATLTTDDMGMATYTVTGPKATKGNTDMGRTDTIIFTSDVDGSGGDPGDADSGETEVYTIVWSDADPVLTATDGASAVGAVPEYAIISNGKVSIRATVSVYDQYGNPAGSGKRIAITIGSAGTDPAGEASTRVINSRGMASHRATVTPTAAGTNVVIQYGAIQQFGSNGTTLEDVTDAPSVTGGTAVTPVNHATDDSTVPAGDIGSPNVSAVYGDDNRFRIGGALYTYDSDDTYLKDGDRITMAKFEEEIGVGLKAGTGQTKTEANIQVVIYDDDGNSIFKVVESAAVS